MPTDEHVPEPHIQVGPTEPARPRSRRSLLAAAAAAGGALATQALVRPAPVSAANVVLGAVNTATATTTIRNTQAVNTAKALVGLVTYTGVGGATAGVQGQSNASGGSGVFGYAPAGNSKGVNGRSGAGRGVHGEATGTTGLNYGVYGITPSTSGVGVQGVATATSGSTYGVLGAVTSPGGRAVAGANTGADGTGVYGVAANGTDAKGVHGRTVDGRGVYGESTGTYSQNVGVYGESKSNGRGVVGVGMTGVMGIGSTGVSASGTEVGVFALAGPGTSTTGIVATGGEHGVYASSVIGAAVFADGNQAGYFLGKVFVEGTFASTDKQFQIDHPQDPANRTLTHSCVEAPERLNIYRGSVTLDANGRATVRMPGYFRALNADYGYQLTAIGAPAPSLHVARKMTARSFAIAGGLAEQEVCWIVTGVRQDAWAQRHPLRVEQTKRRKDRGKYLNPGVFGKPKSAAMYPAPKVPRRPRRLPRPKAA